MDEAISKYNEVLKKIKHTSDIILNLNPVIDICSEPFYQLYHLDVL